jgi:hypothetical protein
MDASYWRTHEGRLNQAIRTGLRNAGVQGPLADLVGPILREVLAVASEGDAAPDDVRSWCLRKGEPVSPTFTPICTLPLGHDGACNWPERVELRNRLRAEAAARRDDDEPRRPV